MRKHPGEQPLPTCLGALSMGFLPPLSMFLMTQPLPFVPPTLEVEAASCSYYLHHFSVPLFLSVLQPLLALFFFTLNLSVKVTGMVCFPDWTLTDILAK